MAIDNNSLCYLFDSIFQIENVAGRPVVGGHIEVFIAGTDQKYTTWQNFDGTKNPFKIPLNNDGRAVILVEPHYTYDIYIYDSFNNMICSRLNVKPAIGGDVTVYGLTQVWHDESMSGEGTPQSPLSVVSAGKVYTGIEPIVVNNIENKISANHIPLGVQDPLYFVEDSESACIIGMSGGIVPEGTMVESSLGFENNKITGYNGSAFSAGNEYEAGNYISIDNNTLSVTGLSPVPADTASTGLVAEVSADIISQIPSTAGLATTAQLDEKLDKSDSANFYPMEGNPSGFLTAHQSLQGYATEQWVEGKGYLTSVDIPESAVWNATTQTVSANSATWAGGTANPQIPVTSTSGISIFESGDKVYFNISADYALNSDLENVSAEITGMIPAPFDPTYLSGQIDTKLDSAIYATASGTFLTALPQDLVYTADIQDMATTGQVAEKLDTTAFSTVSGDFLTAVDLTPYQEKEEMTAYATVESLTAKQDAGDYLSATDSANFLLTSDSGNFYTTANESGFITGVDLTPYQLTADMTAYQPVGDYLTTGDSANFYTTANESGFISEVPAGTMNESAFEYDANDKISGYNGSAFAGGSDVPEGVMVESGLEYNAVNEISAYNGSAIAQYGAEKQWLQHDDTIVHISNSAQYAFGVNLSGISADLARMMGIDETVLFETTAQNGSGICNLSESLKNFRQIKVLAARGSTYLTGGYPGPWSFWETDGISADGYDFHAISPFMFEGTDWKNGCYSANSTYTVLKFYKGVNKNMVTNAGSTAGVYTDSVGIKAVIGIGRKN